MKIYGQLAAYLLKNRLLLAIGVAVSCVTTACFLNGGSTSASSMPDEVDYNYHIRPILSDRCFKCHGPDANKREADLRLDTEAAAYAALKDNPKLHAIVPGDLRKLGSLAQNHHQRHRRFDAACGIKP